MSIHWSMKGLAEQRLMEALVRTRDALRRQVVALLVQRVSVIAAVLLLVAIPAWAEHDPAADWRVCFTPGDPCTDGIVHALSLAQQRILVQAYSFTSVPIATALRDAHRRGVQVQIILDKSQRSEKYSSADFLANQGVSVLIDTKHAIAHNKLIIIDNYTVIGGSFNYTQSAETRNAENVTFIRGHDIANQFTLNWQKHVAHSTPYVGRLKR